MSQKKISDLSELIITATGDLIEIVDVSDLTESPTGTNKKLQLSNILFTASQISDFDTEVSNNTDVAANTSAKHTQGTDTTLGTMTSNINLGSNNLLAIKSAEFIPNIIGNSGASKTILLVDGGSQTITIDQNTTLTITAPTNGTRSSLTISGGGSFTVAWVGVSWLTSGATAPTLTATDIITFYHDGTTLWATHNNQA